MGVCFDQIDGAAEIWAPIALLSVDRLSGCHPLTVLIGLESRLGKFDNRR